MLGEKVTVTTDAPSVEMNDECLRWSRRIQSDDDEDESESSDGQSDSSRNTEAIVAVQPLIAWCLLSDTFMHWMTLIDRAGFNIDWWFLVLKHAVLITNIILLESVEPDSSKAKGIERRRSVWEGHFREQTCLESYLLGPFGCWSFMILTA